jgi:hypothetical protein
VNPPWYGETLYPFAPEYVRRCFLDLDHGLLKRLLRDAAIWSRPKATFYVFLGQDDPFDSAGETPEHLRVRPQDVAWESTHSWRLGQLRLYRLAKCL